MNEVKGSYKYVGICVYICGICEPDRQIEVHEEKQLAYMEEESGFIISFKFLKLANSILLQKF